MWGPSTPNPTWAAGKTWVALYMHVEIGWIFDSQHPEASFLHVPVPPGADPEGNIKGPGLVDDLQRRQGWRLVCGSDPHSKLPRLLGLKPTIGDFWHRLDMTDERHAVMARHVLAHAGAPELPTICGGARPCGYSWSFCRPVLLG